MVQPALSAWVAAVMAVALVARAALAVAVKALRAALVPLVARHRSEMPATGPAWVVQPVRAGQLPGQAVAAAVTVVLAAMVVTAVQVR